MIDTPFFFIFVFKMKQTQSYPPNYRISSPGLHNPILCLLVILQVKIW